MPILQNYDLSSLVERFQSNLSVFDPNDGDVKAAVSVILRSQTPESGLEVLLIERALRDGDPWSGHMAFPGGRTDVHDTTLQNTAMREAHEEVGVDLGAHATFLARLPDVQVVVASHGVNMKVAVFVFVLQRFEEVLQTNHEVADTVWVSLASLARGERLGKYVFEWQGVRREMPCHKVGRKSVWGLTYWMFEKMFEVIHRE
jgi:8-oxo-dGTP pyrophosphatase MutT (NUDIX family)